MKGNGLINLPDPGGGNISIIPLKVVAGAGAWATVANSNQMLDVVVYNTTGADGDYFTDTVFLAAGIYKIQVLYYKTTNTGIVDIDIDGVEVLSFDEYAASATYNQIHETTGIVIASSGLKTLDFRVDGKNVASSGYTANSSLIRIIRTA